MRLKLVSELQNDRQCPVLVHITLGLGTFIHISFLLISYKVFNHLPEIDSVVVAEKRRRHQDRNRSASLIGSELSKSV